MSATTAYRFKRALRDVIKAHPAFAGVQVSYGPPGPSDAYEIVYVGSTSGTQEIASMKQGRKTIDEEYQVELFIEVMLEAVDTLEPADARVDQLWTALADLMAEDPTLGTDFIRYAVIVRHDEDGGVWDRGFYSGTRLGINVKARLANSTPVA